jgi:hypothetical protein
VGKVSVLLKAPKRLRVGVKRTLAEKRATLRNTPTREHERWRTEHETAGRMRDGSWETV